MVGFVRPSSIGGTEMRADFAGRFDDSIRLANWFQLLSTLMAQSKASRVQQQATSPH